MSVARETHDEAIAKVKEAIEGWLEVEVMEAKRLVDAERTVEVAV